MVMSVAVEAESFGVGDEARAVVVFVALAAARPQLVGVGLAVQDVHAVAALGCAPRAGEELTAVLYIVLQRRQARRVRLADPAREAAAEGGPMVADQVHGVQHVALAHRHALLALLAHGVPATVAVYEGQPRPVLRGQERDEGVLTGRGAALLLAQDDGITAVEEVVQRHLAPRAHRALQARVVTQLRGALSNPLQVPRRCQSGAGPVVASRSGHSSHLLSPILAARPGQGQKAEGSQQGSGRGHHMWQVHSTPRAERPESELCGVRACWDDSRLEMVLTISASSMAKVFSFRIMNTICFGANMKVRSSDESCLGVSSRALSVSCNAPSASAVYRRRQPVTGPRLRTGINTLHNFFPSF